MLGSMRARINGVLATFAASGLACVVSAGLVAEASAQSNEAGVTDLTGASPEAIQTTDIIEALAVPRGTRIEPGAPPTVRLPVYFEFDSAQLRPDAQVLLQKVGAALSTEELADFSFSVEGHTDSVGPDGYNLGLSSRRAAEVARYLEDQGVDVQRLDTKGLGEGKPVASNDSDEGRQRNRRVELINLGANNAQP